MKKIFLLFPLIILGSTLTACDNTSWAWWEDDNITIEKYVSMKDAMKALDSSATHFDLATASKSKYSRKTYYKEYLGKFSTETDSDISSSMNVVSNKYPNNVVVTNTVSDTSESFLNAKSVQSFSNDTYLICQEDKSILQRSITDYGYGEKVGSNTIIPYSTDETLKLYLSIGSTLSSSSISWDKATYGFSKNNDIIIETMSSSSGSYIVKFNGKTIQTYVTNIYNKYRLKKVEQKQDSSEYMLDYSYSKIEILIGSSIFDEPLKEPFLLEKTETVTEYSTSVNKDYDISKIPEVKTE